MVVDDVVLRRHDLREPVDALGLRHRGLDQKDVGLRGHHVRPLDVEARLVGPAVVVGAQIRAGRAVHLDVQFEGLVVIGPSGVITWKEGGLGRPILRVEGLQVGGDGRGAEGIDDDDRLALALDPPGEQRGQVVGPLELEGLVAGDAEVRLALRRGRRLRHMARRHDVPGRKRDHLDRRGGRRSHRGDGRRSHRSAARPERRDRCHGRAANQDQCARTSHPKSSTSPPLPEPRTQPESLHDRSPLQVGRCLRCRGHD